MTAAIKEVLKLSPEERLLALEMIWDSLRDHPQSTELTEAQQADLARRYAEYKAGKSDPKDWDLVRQEAEALLRK